MEFTVRDLSVINESFGDDPMDFSALVHAEVVEAGTPGGEAFIVNVVSPVALSRIEEPEVGRGLLVAVDYDLQAIRERLDRLVRYAPVTDWSGLCAYLDRFFDRV